MYKMVQYGTKMNFFCICYSNWCAKTPEEVDKTPEEVDSRTPEEVDKTPEEVDSRTPEEVD
jgi:hypothetical protein